MLWVWRGLTKWWIKSLFTINGKNQFNSRNFNMLKIALIGTVFFHPKEMLFNTYTYTLNKVLIVTSAPSSLQLILLKCEPVRSVRALLSGKAPWWWYESVYLLWQNMELGIWRATSWNHVSRTAPPFLVVTDILQLSSFPPHKMNKKVISLKNCPCFFIYLFILFFLSKIFFNF